MMMRRRFLFAITAMLLASAGTGGVLLAADLFVHHLAEDSAGLNRWGYRGPVVAAKQPGEFRIVMVGGSTVFGYGCKWFEALPAQLERELRAARPQQLVSVINLGYNNEGAFAALPTLEDYRYLGYDMVILYEGYNDRQGDGIPNTQVYRRQSFVFRLTGYSPILPWALKEKARQLRGGAAGDDRPVFRPGVAARTSAGALEAATAISDALSRQLDRLSEAPAAGRVLGAECQPPWSHYCASVVRAIDYARSMGAKALVATQPIYPAEKNVREEGGQQAGLRAAIDARFGHDRQVRFLDLSRAIDLSDPQLSFDSMHLGPAGNLRLAQALEPAVEALAWDKLQ